MTNHREVIERLEAATGPHRELDLAIGMFWPEPRPFDLAIKQNRGMKPTVYAFTASVDSAAKFAKCLFPGLLWAAGTMEDGHFASFVVPDRSGGFIGGGRHALAATPAIAILILALRALESQNKDKEEGAA